LRPASEAEGAAAKEVAGEEASGTEGAAAEEVASEEAFGFEGADGGNDFTIGPMQGDGEFFGGDPAVGQHGQGDGDDW